MASDLGYFGFDGIENGAIGGTTKAASVPGLLVVLVPDSKTFRSVIECITAWFVQAIKIWTGHKHLLDALAA